MYKRIFSCLLILALLLPAMGALAAPAEDMRTETEVDSDIGFRRIPEAENAAYRTQVGEPIRIALRAKNHAEGAAYDYGLIGEQGLRHGSLRPTEDRGVFTYHPATPGVEIFNFTVTSDGLTSEPATVTITIEGQKPLEFLQYHDMMGHWGAFSAGRLAALDLLVGQKAENRHFFFPDRAISRADFLVWLLAVVGVEPTEGGSHLFADHDIPHWLVGFIDAATHCGIIEGVAAGHPHVTSYFHPNMPITKAEALKMVSLAIGVDGHDDNLAGLFRDVHEIPGWAKNHVRHLSEIKVIVGDQSGNLHPNRNLSRGEAAELLYKAFKELVELRDEMR